MNIIFFGSSEFAVPSLGGLLTTKHSVSCIVTQPDKQKGRGLHLEATFVKALAIKNGLRIYQPQHINTEEAAKFLKDLKPDLFVVIAYGQILSSDILSIPRIFAINAHASVLPKFRGAAPINWAIIKGEENTGVTIIKMTEKMDAGPVIGQKLIGIKEDDDAVSLEGKISRIANDLLLQSISAIENNNYTLTEQDEKEATFAPKLRKEDGLIYWHKPARDISNLIKGCLGWPGAYTHYKGKILKIYKAGVFHPSSFIPHLLPGSITQVDKDGIVVATGRDSLIIRELQLEGKRRMESREFILGHKIEAGETLGQ